MSERNWNYMSTNDVCAPKTCLKEELFPAKEEIFSWIRDLTQWGHRKTGTPEGRKSAEYIAAKFKEFGMRDVKIEPVPSMCMFCKDYTLQIDGEEYETFYINAANRGGESGTFRFGFEEPVQEFVYLNDGLPEDFEGIDVTGKIVVCSIRFPGSKPLDMAAWFKRSDIYDPDGSMEKVAGTKPDIYTPDSWPGNYFTALQRGAAGFVGILENYMDDPYFYCEDYTDIGRKDGVRYMSLPGLWVSRSSGKKIKAAFAKNRILTGHMTIESLYEYRDALNVKGVLPGLSDEIILVHSHHDAVFDGAVQDASGIAEMLAVGKYFSRLPREARQKTMMFAATDTHYTDYEGHKGFIQKRKEDGDRILIDLAIEHIGMEAVLDDEGQMIMTGEAEARVVYITEESGLYDFVRDTFAKYGLVRSIFAPVPFIAEPPEVYEFHQDEVISDAFDFSLNGYHIVSTVAGEIYIFHPSDQLDKVAVELLKPVGMAFAEIALKAAEIL